MADKYVARVIENGTGDQVKTLMFKAETRAEAERVQGDLWNLRFAVAEAGRYRCELLDRTGIINTIDPEPDDE